MKEPEPSEKRPESTKKVNVKSPRKPQKSKRLQSTSRPIIIPAFPRVSLEKAIKVAQVINDDFEGKPATLPDVASRVAATSTERPLAVGRVFNSAQMYGLVRFTSEKVMLTELGIDVVAPTSPDQRQSALLKAFSSVELFKKVAEQYAGKRLPEHEFFRNILVREFKIPKDLVEVFTEVFIANLEYVKAFSPNVSGQPISSGFVPTSVTSPDDHDVAYSVSETENVREFLDTCFILMPFGEWFDKYFKEIYLPATRDAGFEPLRADGLFNVGAVMEQIWGQIQKAKVLLADLTGKNPNVFYELGLAHALRKPVVFVAGDIGDVPFDVRHLRVVVYDIREPNWAEKLRGEITTYLKSTRTDPEKSIPQPFRESPSEALNEQLDKSVLQPRRRK